MARIVLGAVGAVISSFAGAGPQLGWSIGYAVGGAFEPPQKAEGPKLTDLKVMGTEYGQPIPYLIGTCMVAPQVIWASDRIEVATTTNQGGKGSPGVDVTTYTYKINLLLLISRNAIGGVLRVFSNGELLFNQGANLNGNAPGSGNFQKIVYSLVSSGSTPRWARMTVYDGDVSQLPDPVYEAAVGVGNAPAHRGMGTVFVQELQLGSNGLLPNLVMEVAVNVSNTALFSLVTAPSSSTTWAAIVYAGSGYAAVGNGAETLWSPDARNYEVGTGISDDWTCLTFGMGLFVAMSSTGQSMYGATGVVWSLATTVPDGDWRGVAWNGSVFCAVGDSSGTNMVVTSSDADVWTAQTPSATKNWKAVAWGSGKFVAVSDDGSVMTSPDGSAWTNRTSAVATALRAVAYGGGQFVAVGDSGTIQTSPDGVTWTAQTAPSAINFKGVTYASGQYVAVGVGDNFTLSQDGVAWTDVAHSMGTLTYPAVTGNGTSYVGLTTTNPTSAFFGSPAFNGGTSSLQSAVEQIVLQTGLVSGQIDASPLSAIAQPVRGFALANVGPMDNYLDVLMTTHFFDCVLYDKLYFKPRTGSPFATIPFIELGAGQDGNETDPFNLKPPNDLELPAKIIVRYPNVDIDWQTDAQYADRSVTTVPSQAVIDVPIGLTAAEAQAMAEAIATDNTVSAVTSSISLLFDYAELEPGDKIIVVMESGHQIRMRIVRRTDVGQIIQLDLVRDDDTLLTNDGVTSVTYSPSLVTVDYVVSEALGLDIPTLRDADNGPMYYVVARPLATGDWTGGEVWSSLDDIQYDKVGTTSSRGVFGVTTSTLAGWSGGNVVDYVNSVTVDVGLGGTLATVSRDTMLDGPSNVALIGDEVVLFRVATLISTGVYKLTELVRGRQGTEWAAGIHATGDRFVMLDATSVRRIGLQTSDIGGTRYFKVVTFGMKLSSATSQSIAPNGRSLRPYSPVDYRVFRDAGTNDITVNWSRRSRLSKSFTNGAVPLGEEVEKYDAEIYTDGTYTTVKRTFSALTSPTFTYTSAQQTTDFGGAQTTIYVRVYQISAVVARGYALEGAL